MMGFNLTATLTSANDPDASSWTFVGSVLLGTSIGVGELPISGWNTTVTKAEAQAEPSPIPDSPGVWPGEVQPLNERAQRVADRRMLQLFVDALAAQV